MDLNAILDRIDLRLADLGISAEQASLRSGLSRDGIRNLRRAARKQNTDASGGAQLSTLTKLCHGLETDVTWLITGVGHHDDDVSDLLRQWDSMSPANRRRLLDVAHGLAEHDAASAAQPREDTDADLASGS